MAKEEVFVGSIDQGTTSTRFIIYDKHARPVGSHQVEFTQFYPQAGWVEHDPMEILESVRICIAKAVDKATAGGYNVDNGLKAIGITNQRETTVVWSKSTGVALYNAIVWMDVRTSSICRKLEKELSRGRIHFVESCGLPISTYFSALKLLWLLENVDAVKAAVKKGDALFGTIDSWLIWNLTGGVDNGLHVTDVSNASRTMLMNLKTLDWDEPTLETLKIPKGILPKIVSNSEVIGRIGKGWLIPGIPISGCLGDQHAAMLGQSCRKGEAKSTYGTGAFILLNTGEEVIQSKHGLLSTLAFKLGKDAPTNYALEGSIAIAGAAVQWLRDSLGIISFASEIEELAAQVDSTGGVYFVPAFNGLFAPWWRDDARGVLIGITRFTNKSHIARAVLESMCFQVKDVLDSMHKDTGEKGEMKNEKGQFLLRVDGGATVNNSLMQIQADLLGNPVVRPADIETTALGAAYAAGLAVGVWTEEDIFSNGERMKKATTFNPVLNEELRKKKMASWCKEEKAKRKKVTTSLAVNQTSVLRQAPVASVNAPVVAYLPQVLRTVGHSQISLLAQNQTASVTAPVVCSPFPTSVAMSTPVSITSNSSAVRFPKAVCPASTDGYPRTGYQNMEKAVAAEETLSKVKEAKLQAENIALLAAAEVGHCQGVWNRLERERSSGVVSDEEAKLMSSAVSIAAAAAKIASNVAEQARLMADEVFLSSKTENFDRSSSISHPNVVKSFDKATPTSILKSVEKSNHPNSIISAAREAARWRIEAASTASKHAENLDAIVKAADLAAEAVSQAGKIVAMGDSSALRELVEAGPEGYWKTSQLAYDQQGEISGHQNSSSDKKNVEAAPNVSIKEIQTLKHGLAPQETFLHLAENQMMVIDYLSGSITGNEKDTKNPRAHKGPNLSKAAGVAPETDTGSLHTYVVGQNMTQSTSGAWEEHNIKEGCLVEGTKVLGSS